MTEQDEKGMNREDMERILGEQDVGVLCLSKNDEPYGVTVSYALINGEIVFHCRKLGKKTDFIATNPQVCFVVSRHPEPSKPHHPDGECNFSYESVVCCGKARIVEDLPERYEYLKKFKAHFDRRLGADPAKDPVPESAAGKINMVVITVDELTGRRNG